MEFLSKGRNLSREKFALFIYYNNFQPIAIFEPRFGKESVKKRNIKRSGNSILREKVL